MATVVALVVGLAGASGVGRAIAAVPATATLADGTRFHESGHGAEYISWFGASLPLSSSDAQSYSAEGNKAVTTVAVGYVSAHPASNFPAHRAIRIVGSTSEFVDDGQEILPLGADDATACLANLGQTKLAVVPDLWARSRLLGPDTTCAKPQALGPFSLVQTYAPPAESFGIGPIVVSFSGSNQIAGDFNGDGKDDHLIYGEDGASDALWYGTANGFELGPPITVNGSYQPVIADFNGDGRDDVLWYAIGGDIIGQKFASSLWLGRPGKTGFLHGPAIPEPPQTTGSITPSGHIELTAYEPLLGDFNGDGKQDVYWTVSITTQPKLPPNLLWYGAVSGFTVGTASTAPFAVNPFGEFPLPLHRTLSRRIAATAALTRRFDDSPTIDFPAIHFVLPPSIGDYNGDGRDDLLWYVPGQTRLWNGATPGVGFTNASVATVYGFYLPIVGDFDGDGHADVLWYGLGTVSDSLWRGTGSGFQAGPSVTVNGQYVPTVGDFNGDGKQDVFWYDAGGHHHTWFGSASGFTHGLDSITAADNVDEDIVTTTVGDFNGDGHQDLLFWRDHSDFTDPFEFTDVVTVTLWHAH